MNSIARVASARIPLLAALLAVLASLPGLALAQAGPPGGGAPGPREVGVLTLK